ncbi:RidA family protein [Peribacillus cavernae]|uniref:RidA family protein n=1 Tax=Peribacillus cavernae TaxID=1674310 RepID=A0A3S0TS19_9BACI|nr:RidA family protein [Peribacillus cavernae]MDQ0219853.1 enamine deaminase RidA (YjgF/YER057c/UK114 family) [Peribacillus cavernae]RUQ26654.1 RidA family protein [Peribacillus cavernae]
MDKIRIMPKGHWDWSIPVSFSQGWKVGNLIFVGGQVPRDEEGNTVGVGDIEAQTHNVFENIRIVLNEAGADMKDIVKLNTFYRFDGKGEEALEFWEKMTKVRMEYLPEQDGPAGTAVRVSGFARDDVLLEVEAIAVVPDEN